MCFHLMSSNLLGNLQSCLYPGCVLATSCRWISRLGQGASRGIELESDGQPLPQACVSKCLAAVGKSRSVAMSGRGGLFLSFILFFALNNKNLQ